MYVLNSTFIMFFFIWRSVSRCYLKSEFGSGIFRIEINSCNILTMFGF